MRLHEGGKQHNNKADQWEAIKTIMLEMERDDVKNLKKTMDNRLRRVTISKCKGSKTYHICLLFVLLQVPTWCNG